MADFRDFIVESFERLNSAYEWGNMKHNSQTYTTEDGIPITKLHVKNLHKTMTSESLHTLFSRYGKVTDVYVRYAQPNAPPRPPYKLKEGPIFAFVTYDTVEEANKARESVIKFRGLKLVVSPADSWQQPRPPAPPIAPAAPTTEDTQRQPSGSQGTHSTQSPDDADSPEVFTILDILNHDCLLHILSYLPLKDLIRSERVSRAWRALVAQQLSTLRELRTELWPSHHLKLTTGVLRSLLLRVGPGLRRLYLNHEWSNLNDRTPQIISKFCPDLERLLCMNVHMRSWMSVALTCQHLTSVGFISCSNITDELMRAFTARLKNLTLVHNDKNTAAFLEEPQFSDLQKLTLSNCRMIDGEVLTELLSRLKSLTALSLDRPSSSVCRHIEGLLEKLPHLTEFSMGDVGRTAPSSLACVASLAHLTVLHLPRNCLVDNELLRLISKGCTRLQVLDISGCYFKTLPMSTITEHGLRYVWQLQELQVLDVSMRELLGLGLPEGGRQLPCLTTLVCIFTTLQEESLLSLMQQSPQLQKLDLMGCSHLDEEFIKAVAELMKQTPRQHPLTLYVKNTTVSTDVDLKALSCPSVGLHVEDEVSLKEARLWRAGRERLLALRHVDCTSESDEFLDDSDYDYSSNDDFPDYWGGHDLDTDNTDDDDDYHHILYL